jgi:hypothetical protein
MSKLFPSLFFFISFNCFAYLSSNCSNVVDNVPKAVDNFLNYICCYDDLNKINGITENTTIFNDWIIKGYFIIIDQANNIALLPYEIFKKLLRLSYLRHTNYELIEDSTVIPIGDTSIIPKIANISSLVKLPINSIDKFIVANKYNRGSYNDWNAMCCVKVIVITASVILVMVFIYVCVKRLRVQKGKYYVQRRNSDI